MAGFVFPVDIGNRALQHCGVRRIALFTDSSKNAAEVAFAYDKCRKAELRRRVWRFATRRVALRAITSVTQLIAPLTWLVGTTYQPGAIVADPSGNGQLWMSMLSGNIGNTPGLSNSNIWFAYHGPMTCAPYTGGISYYAGELASSGGVVYISLVGSNAIAPPSSSWLSVGNIAGSSTFSLSPLPANNDGQVRNLYRLPAGYLRVAPQDTKNANVEYLGTSAGIRYSDYEFEGSFLLTAALGPLIFRFVADITDVVAMDAMFCEGLAARIGLEVNKPLTGSPQLAGEIAQEYSRWITEAGKVNAIEVGSTEDDETAAAAGQSQPTGPQPAAAG
jgi:hypothetical protein